MVAVLYIIRMNQDCAKQPGPPGHAVSSRGSKQLKVPGTMKCPKCFSPMDESNHDSIGIAECFFCGFRLVSDEQEEEYGKDSASFPRDEADIVERR
jgi:hypothetical protein